MNFQNGNDFDGTAAARQQLENDLLRLKMQAELGARFGTFPDNPKLSPQMERAFLEQVLEFEAMHRELAPVTVRAYLGNPVFRPARDLDPDELNSEWKRLTDLYRANELGVDFIADYPLPTMYDFMAGELLDEEIAPIPGWCFIYEVFHPNHDFEQRQRTRDFMTEFFGGRFGADTLSSTLVSPDGEIFDLPAAQELLDRFHGVLGEVERWKFDITGTSVQTDAELAGLPPEASRLGCTEGVVEYVCLPAEGGQGCLTGPFKLYMECCDGWWSVMSFEVFGFSWSR